MRTHPKRIAITIILGLAAISTFGFLLSKAQSYLVERNMQQEMIENSEYIKSAVAVNSHAGENVRRWFFGLHKAYLLMLNKMINEDPSLIESDQFYRDMNAMMETQDLMLIDREGNIVKSASGSVHDLKEERYKPLLDSFDSGEVKDYGEVDPPYMENLWNMVDAIRGEDGILCSGETALLQTRAVEDMRVLQPEAQPFPETWVRREETMTWVPGLAKALWACYEGRTLPNWDMRTNNL